MHSHKFPQGNGKPYENAAKTAAIFEGELSR
jgi:hypothetical protein